MNATVRSATLVDARDACDVVRRSISQLCFADHNDDPRRLEAWLRNKTVASTEEWLASPELFNVVACDDKGVCGFGAISRDGEVLFCYVDPRVRFQRISTMMLEELERAARSWDLRSVRLTSTLTAQRFYTNRGYNVAGEAIVVFDAIKGIPMMKRLL
jgi:GNAT superfamily N-acetyltransferase